jgi:hypothetical protein
VYRTGSIRYGVARHSGDSSNRPDYSGICPKRELHDDQVTTVDPFCLDSPCDQQAVTVEPIRLRPAKNERFHRRTAHLDHPQTVQHDQADDQNRDGQATQYQTECEP